MARESYGLLVVPRTVPAQLTAVRIQSTARTLNSVM